MEVLPFFGWLACPVGAGGIASSKHRSFSGYFLSGFIFPFIGLLVAIGTAPRQPTTPRAN